MPEERPLLFLDVDGVLNPDIPQVECDSLSSDSSFSIVNVPKGTKDHLAKLQKHFEIIWATAWLGDAHSFFREHLDLPQDSWPYLDYKHLKLIEIIRFAKDRPWAWVDDDANAELRALGDNFRDMPNSLIIVPKRDIGLTDEHVEELLEFAKERDGSAKVPHT
jgi:hypothetical protein